MAEGAIGETYKNSSISILDSIHSYRFGDGGRRLLDYGVHLEQPKSFFFEPDSGNLGACWGTRDSDRII